MIYDNDILKSTRWKGAQIRPVTNISLGTPAINFILNISAYNDQNVFSKVHHMIAKTLLFINLCGQTREILQHYGVLPLKLSKPAILLNWNKFFLFIKHFVR